MFVVEVEDQMRSSPSARLSSAGITGRAPSPSRRKRACRTYRRLTPSVRSAPTSFRRQAERLAPVPDTHFQRRRWVRADDSAIQFVAARRHSHQNA